MVEWDNCPSGSIPARLWNVAGSIPALRSIYWGVAKRLRRKTLTLVSEGSNPSTPAKGGKSMRSL